MLNDEHELFSLGRWGHARQRKQQPQPHQKENSLQFQKTANEFIELERRGKLEVWEKMKTEKSMKTQLWKAYPREGHLSIFLMGMTYMHSREINLVVMCLKRGTGVHRKLGIKVMSTEEVQEKDDGSSKQIRTRRTD